MRSYMSNFVPVYHHLFKNPVLQIRNCLRLRIPFSFVSSPAVAVDPTSARQISVVSRTAWLSSRSFFILMAKPAVLQLGPLQPETPALREALEKRFDYYSLSEQPDADSFIAEKGRLIQGLVTCSTCDPLLNKLVTKLPNLEIVSSFSEEDEEPKDVALCRKLGVRVTHSNTKNALSVSAPDDAQVLLLAITREIVAADGWVRRCRWPCKGDYPTPFRLTNKRVGVVGFGRIGTEIARRLEGLGGTIAYWSRSAKPQYPNYTFFHNVVDLAKHCDILIVSCHLTKETTKLINRRVLDALGPQGFLVNISRGLVVDGVELAKALVEGRIAGAGLDLFQKERYVPQEILNLETVVVQPHSKMSKSDTHRAMAELVVANLEAHFGGEAFQTRA